MSKLGTFALHLSKHYFVYMLLHNFFEIIQLFLRIFCIIFWIFPIKSNKIVFNTNMGAGFSDHAKYIVMKLLDMEKEYDLVWIVRNISEDNELPAGVRQVKLGGLREQYELATAKIWVDNDKKRGRFVKRKRQYYIQTWHGFGPKMNNVSNLPYFYRKSLLHDSNMTDIYVSNNNLLSDFYKKYFWYSGEILEVGFPRCDLFYTNTRDEITAKVKSRLGIDSENKMILYAPTYRQDADVSVFLFDYLNCLKKLKVVFGGEWTFVLRLHPAVSHLSKKIVLEYGNVVVDATGYLDVQELFYASDILITDYSSCMFDFALTRRLVVLYAPDYKIENEKRGFCMEYAKLPFPIAQSYSELLSVFDLYDENAYKNRLNKAFQQYRMCDKGIASKAVVDWIEKKIKEDS